jgi:outer membrane protein assembly factor BamE (lipoprotein component of BamABCDE complex)
MTARRAIAFLAALAGLAAAGCSTVGNGRMVQLDTQQARTLLVPGRSTRADVRQAFGEGAVIRFQSGRETWHYLYREGIAPGWDEVPYIGLVTSRLHRPTKELVILFEADGVLKRWSLQEYRGAAANGG